jgi:hypothetical protein
MRLQGPSPGSSWESVVFCAEGSRLDRISSQVLRQQELVEQQVYLEEYRECLRVKHLERLSLQLPNMTSSPTFLTPTCSRFTRIC